MLRCKAHEWGEEVQRESVPGSWKKKRRHGRDCRKTKGNNSRFKKIIIMLNGRKQEWKTHALRMCSKLRQYLWIQSCLCLTSTLHVSLLTRVGFAAGKWASSTISSCCGTWTFSKHGIFVFGRITQLCCLIRGNIHSRLQAFFCFSHI